MSVKWHNLKVILRYSEGMDRPIVMDMGWMLGVALKFVADYHKSVAQYPNIKTGEEFEGYPLARP